MQKIKTKSPINRKPENHLTFMGGSRDSAGIDGGQRQNQMAMMGVEVSNFGEENKSESVPEVLGKYLQPSFTNLV